MKSLKLPHDPQTTGLRAWLLRPSVRVKIMGIVLVLVLVLGFGITWQVRESMTDALRSRLRERGISIGRDLAARSTDLILINNTFALHELLKDTIENNTDLRYAFILDSNDRVLVHSFDEGFPRNLADQNVVTPEQRAHIAELVSDEGRIYDVAVPIFEGRTGVARIGLTEHSVSAAVDELTEQMLLTTLGVSLLGLGAAYLLTLILTRPIRTLVSVTQAVGRGDLSQQAPQWGEDEIGQLSIAFNRMTADLSQAQRAMLQRHRELEALNAVANAMNVPAALTQTLDHALAALLQALALPAGWVFLIEPGGEQLELGSSVGLSEAIAAREVELGFHGCPCTAALRAKQSVLVTPLPERCPLREARVGENRNVVSHITVPILAHDRVLGVLGVASADVESFNPDEVRILESVGQQLGIAVENARLWEDLREKERVRGQLLDKIIVAQEEERKRIARELHDDTGQAITSLMVGLRAAGDACEPETQAHFVALREIAAQTLESVKRLARQLRPPLLDDLGLPAALDRHVASYRTTFGLNADLQVTGLQSERRMAPEIELALYRIVQEALTNIVKHANARTVSIVVERKAHSVVAVVEDDGRGFDARAIWEASQKEGNLGLHGMRERVELVGGRLQLESHPGQGASVFVEIPLDGRAQLAPPSSKETVSAWDGMDGTE